MKTTILCFSGSGNSYWVATTLAAQLGDATVVMIPSLMEGQPIELGKRVGIVYPVYTFFPPNLATYFIEEVLARQDLEGVEYFFQVCTYNLFSSWALFAMERSLNRAGMAVSFTDRVRMADTYVPLFKTPSEERIDRYYRKAAEKIETIGHQIDGTVIKLGPRAPFAKGAARFLMKPIHRSLMDGAAAFAVTDACTACELCYRICPSGNIEMVGGRPAWDRVCSGCLACYHRCPEQAIVFTRRIRGDHYPNQRSGYRTEYR
ncbi:MAG: 4Fe-4S dicluster domain-containing protein [Sphaerochaeta sp.]|nr:4Fe-4S dicluster domain-containing protein [Sphaerochaeta sp.]